MEPNMQDLIARYSRDLLEYGRAHGVTDDDESRTADIVTGSAAVPASTVLTPTQASVAALDNAALAAYTSGLSVGDILDAPPDPTAFIEVDAPTAQVETAPAPVDDGPVLYEDFQAAGGMGTDPGRVVFASKGAAGQQATPPSRAELIRPAPARPATETWTTSAPTRAQRTQTGGTQTTGGGSRIQSGGTQATGGTARGQSSQTNVRQQRTVQPRPAQRPATGTAAQSTAEVTRQNVTADPMKTVQGQMFDQLEKVIMPLRPDDDSLGATYTGAMSAGQNLPDLDADTGDVLGFTTGDLLQLQSMNADRVQNIDVSSMIGPTDGRGWLKVQVYASEAHFPLSNARVVVFQTAGGKNYVIYDKLTDTSGVIEGMVLPAPHKEYSLTPEGVTGKHSQPFASYNLYVEHPGFLRKTYPEISVFDGVDSVKPVFLTPKTVGMADIPPIDFYA
ncbi:MAG: hypothetical protein LBN05_08235 [Oscillospiraceae bacterium]|jgi:hypothetical protein|nr:hypothetical protein [Oscillospiraceae bacterium]